MIYEFQCKFPSKQYINGKLVEGKGKPIDVVNPATGKTVTTVHAATIEQAQEALEAAQEAYKTWSVAPVEERATWLRKLKDACETNKNELIELIQIECGRSKTEASGAYAQFISFFDFFAEEIKRVYGEVMPQCDAKTGEVIQYVHKQALGVTVAHLAWNDPPFNLATKLCPNIVSGCCGVLKPSSHTPLFTLRVAELCAEIGLPAGVINIVFGSSKDIGKYLNESTIPSLITLIGSVETGVEVMRQGATSVKHYSMELGGNAPLIVMPDADLETCAGWIVKRKIGSAGQGCANINRVFLHEDIHDRMVELILDRIKEVPNGWGPDMPDITSGPLIDVAARDEKLALVKKSVEEGAKLLYGGTIPELPDELKDGAFMMPTVLDDVTDEMTCARTELFAPIIQILTFKTLDEVIERANKSDYGLRGYVFTYDFRVINRCIHELQHGGISINLAGEGPNVPHVGMKNSGTGCVRSKWSLDEYLQLRVATMTAK